MIQFAGQGVLLDIEGTTSSIRFVLDVMFPYARRELDGFLAEQWRADEMDRARRLMAADAGYGSWDAWCDAAGITGDEASSGRELLRAEALRLMDRDAKATGLKYLQGLIWRSGFESGELRAHVYDDVPPALAAWQRAGLDLRVYSSGSVEAQKLFFGHTVHGNLLPRFSAHYDTTIGSKKEAPSYRRIVDDVGVVGEQILFLSDVPAELDAAREAGLRTALARRPENPDVEAAAHPEFTSFAEIHVARAE